MADDRDEKFDEKETEKHEEKTPEEKSWDEKWRNDPLTALTWAVIFIWGGLVLLADNLGWLDIWRDRLASIPGLAASELTPWSLIFAGAGVIVLVETLVRLLVPDYRRPLSGRFILAAVLIGIGLGGIFSWNLVWPLILIAIGLSILLQGFWRRR
jgi:hypothetical protein